MTFAHLRLKTEEAVWIHTANRGGGLDAGAWAGAERRLHTHSTERTWTPHLLLLHRAFGTVIPLKHGRYLETLPFYFGRPQNETFGNDDVMSVCERQIEKGVCF